ncbi:uncharacterized protein LOC62_05G007782 [Vanrija pseudolonga]|uniref:Uncharacterized protein n=1 Tax=Vanrija pseudolonga TaxID=143232 RepID=A0AAF0YD69_9TREE|nr:hypothetical protein LOC62_05G007782 [Vanrija pseudolonga]
MSFHSCEEEEQVPLTAYGGQDHADDLDPVMVQLPKARGRPRHHRLSRAHVVTAIVALIAAIAGFLYGKSASHPTISPAFSSALTGLTTLPHFKVNDPNEMFNYRWWTEAKLRSLVACIIRGDCAPNADKVRLNPNNSDAQVIIVNTIHCQWALDDDYHGGEGIWCLGMIRSWERQGYTVLHGGDLDWPFVYNIYRQIPDLVKVIVSDGGKDDRRGSHIHYLKSNDRPDGIPAWKFFLFSYYPTGMTTEIGPAWAVTAEPGRGGEYSIDIDSRGVAWLTTGEEALDIRTKEHATRYTFLGYELEPSAEETTFTDPNTRPYRVWIMAKYAKYFQPNDQQVYDLAFYDRAFEELSKEFPGLEFVGGWKDERSTEDQEKYPMPKHVKNLGVLNATRFEDEFAQARLMLGMGTPTLSPSPYRALAKAVAFGHPHKIKEGGTEWPFMQHDSMAKVPEPYVYQIEAYNYDSFVGAIRKALQSPPTRPLRFLRMRRDVADKRLVDFVNADWRGEAEVILKARHNGHETQAGGTQLKDFVL